MECQVGACCDPESMFCLAWCGRSLVDSICVLKSLAKQDFNGSEGQALMNGPGIKGSPTALDTLKLDLCFLLFCCFQALSHLMMLGTTIEVNREYHLRCPTFEVSRGVTDCPKDQDEFARYKQAF